MVPMVAVETRHYDNANSGCNYAETVLTAPAVKARGITHAFTHVLPGDARGLEGVPLIAPQVKLADGRTMDLAVYGTMGNLVCAFDARSEAMIWARQVGTPIRGTKQIDGWEINDGWGILSTGLLDLANNVWWGCSWQSVDGTAAKGEHFVIGINLADGSYHCPPVSLEGVVYAPPGGIEQRFVSAIRKQRASLTMVNGVAFIPFGSVSETARTSRGWVIAFDTAQKRVTAAWASIASAEGFGGGFWMAGAKLAADSAGYLYGISSNGTFDAKKDWGETASKLRYTPPASPTAMGTLEMADHWTPWTDDSREGLDPSGDEYGEPKPTNIRAFNAAGAKGWNDMDYGSGALSLIEELRLGLGAGKDGICFPVNTEMMGGTVPADFESPAAYKANYAKLAAPPVFATYYPPTLSPQPTDPATLNVLYDNCTHHQHGEFCVMDDPTHGWMMFCHGENENLRAWTIPASKRPTYAAIGAEVASVQSPRPQGGMPGGMISLTCDGATPGTGIVWDVIPITDANMELSPGRLIAYDATNFGTYAGGSRSLQVIWDSQDWGILFTMNKFGRVVVSGGYLYLMTYDATVMVFILTPEIVAAVQPEMAPMDMAA